MQGLTITRIRILILFVRTSLPNLDVTLQWIRPPVQTRSEQTLKRLLDATTHLLNDRSFEKLTVQEIVREASSSVGSFYARFDGKEAVLQALHERYVAESWPTTDASLAPEAWQAVPLRQILEGLCSFLVEFTWDNRGLKRALVIACAQDATYRRRSSELAGYVVIHLATLLESRASEHRHPDAALAADFIHRVVFSFLDQMVAFGHDDPVGNPRRKEALAAELAVMLGGYLQLRDNK